MFIRTLTASVIFSALMVGTVGASADPAANQASYWGTNCTKTEMSGEATFTPSSSATKVIVKGGTGNQVYTTAPFTNLTAPINPNNNKPYGISHVIVCTDTVTTVTPAAATTTAPKAGKGSEAVDKTATASVKAPSASSNTANSTTAAATNTGTGANSELAVPAELPAVGPAQMLLVLIAATVATMFGYVAHSRFTAYRIA